MAKHRSSAAGPQGHHHADRPVRIGLRTRRNRYQKRNRKGKNISHTSSPEYLKEECLLCIATSQYVWRLNQSSNQGPGLTASGNDRSESPSAASRIGQERTFATSNRTRCPARLDQDGFCNGWRTLVDSQA